MALARHSRGVPRLLNVLAHKCLMLAYGENGHRVTPRHVRLAVADTGGVNAVEAWWHKAISFPFATSGVQPTQVLRVRPRLSSHLHTAGGLQ